MNRAKSNLILSGSLALLLSVTAAQAAGMDDNMGQGSMSGQMDSKSDEMKSDKMMKDDTMKSDQMKKSDDMMEDDMKSDKMKSDKAMQHDMSDTPMKKDPN